MSKPTRPSGLTILFSGMIAADPYQGGASWAVLQYLLGLRKLGHRVLFVEPVKAAKLQPAGAGLDPSSNAAYFRQVTARFGLDGAAALLLEGTEQTVGLPYDRIREAAAGADVLMNVSGMLADDELVGRIPARVYLDLDPAFIQVWHAGYGIDMGFARHTHFVTVGQAVGRPGCPVPTCGLDWVPTFQPVDLDAWQPGREIGCHAFTSIGNWRGYGSVEHGGVFYGQKAHSFRQLIDLPRRTAEPLLMGLAIHPGEVNDLRALSEHGWQLTDPAAVAGTPDAYQQFVSASKGELGIAKAGYVASRCGWFSDRSACYLAAGRPVVAQETGFSQFMPTGEGVFAFATATEAAAAIATVNGDYRRHADAARALAEAYFDSAKVLARLLRTVGA
jgi:hypothetical protein